MIAKIAVDAANFAIDKPYSYFIPLGMTVQPGMRVQVSFGRGNRRSEGVVLSVEAGDPTGLKPIDQVLDAEPLLNDTMLHLAAFMRERCFCTFYDAIRAMLPAGLWFQTKETYKLTEDRTWQGKTLRVPFAEQFLQILTDGGNETSATILKEAAGDEQAYEKAVAYLLRKKWITTEVDFLRRTSDKTEKIATLAVAGEEAMAFAATRPKSAQMQKNVLELLCGIGSASVKEICYFTGAKPSTVKRLADLGYVTLSEKEVLRCRQIKPVKLTGPLVLNDQQSEAFEGLSARLGSEKPGTALLYGITGSGKTAVYIQLIRRCLDMGKQAMLLVPEIALTPQLLGLLAAYFGEKVAVLHSSLPGTERYDQWKRIRSKDASVVVGTRSAVFAPCKDLGLIILDEEQEHSYKSENTPRYDARELAQWRGLKEKALVLFGSATPSVQTMFYAKSGIYQMYKLDSRYNGKALPQVEIVDMRTQLQMGNDLSVSYSLQDAIGDARNMGKQSILFLNRRGNSRALVCIRCGEAPECPRCSARLTYHSANERLMCHYCGYSQKASRQCDKCGGHMKQVGTGTQKVQQELENVFPDMQILRMDADTVSATSTHEMILEKFENEHIPVLVGTQMVAKGLNLPDVTLVGVLDADMGLHMGTYRAAETTFNLLTQVVGRAGRGDTPGKAIIQTYLPEHQVICLAAKQDYDGFYDMEIRLRKLQNSPPFGDQITVTFTGQDEGAVLRGAAKFRDSLRTCLNMPEYKTDDCKLLGPAPCFVPKINYNFRYCLTLRCKMNKQLRLLLAHLLRQFSQDKANRGVSAFIEVNGFE